MEINELYIKMISNKNNTIHDINHLTKVWAFARNIGESEHLDPKTQYILEASAILHDIACPMLRKQYGHADGKLQEKYGPDMARKFLKDSDLTPEQIKRIVYLIGHHHTFDNIDGLDYQILVEADYLVNAEESEYSKENILNMYDRYFKTETGEKLLRSIYLD